MERVLIQTESRSMGLEWRRRGLRLMSQHTSPWTAVRLVKVSMDEVMVWVVKKTLELRWILIKQMKNIKLRINRINISNKVKAEFI